LTLALPSSFGDGIRTYSGNFGNDRVAAEKALSQARHVLGFSEQRVDRKQLDFVQALFSQPR
jgi:hypothetical protein